VWGNLKEALLAPAAAAAAACAEASEVCHDCPSAPRCGSPAHCGTTS
jgi:hypothetical protein